jgi:hypothetical protein
VKSLLLSLYPRRWRQHYGDELAATIEDLDLTPNFVLDLIRGSLVASWTEFLCTPWQVAIMAFLVMLTAQELVMVSVVAGSYSWIGHFPDLRVQIGPLLFWRWWHGTHGQHQEYGFQVGPGSLLITTLAICAAGLISWGHKRHQSGSVLLMK